MSDETQGTEEAQVPQGGTERERRVPTTDLYEAAKAREGETNSGPTVLDEQTGIPDRRGAPREGGAGAAAGAAASDAVPAPAGAAAAHTSSRPSVVATRAPQFVTTRWVGGHAFEGGRDGGPSVLLDGKAPDGPSPVDGLLAAIGSCAGYDVVDILAKQRTPLEAMDIDVLGERVDTIPRRLKRVKLTFRIAGKGIELPQAERAVALSIEKYCSVLASLREDVAVEWQVDVVN